MEGIEFLRSMRKRRVGVTARSRRNVGNQASGAQQFGTEMAAPQELRTPAGTCGKGCKESADGSMATKARGRQRTEEQSEERLAGKERERGTACYARMRRCLILRQGASPLRPPAPFPSSSILWKRVNPSRVRFAGQKPAALDGFTLFRQTYPGDEGKGGPGWEPHWGFVL